MRRLIARVDIALDPMPFSGATTTLESLWQGVPVVTLPGQISASRSTASILTALHLTGWIASGRHDYIAIVARALGSRDAQDSLAALRAALPARVQQSALCDVARFTRALEEALRDTWRPGAGARPSRARNRRRRPPSRSGTRCGASPPTRSSPRSRRCSRRASVERALVPAGALVDERPEWHAAQRAYLRTLLAWARVGRDSSRGCFHRRPAPSAGRASPRSSARSIPRASRRFGSYERRFAEHPLEMIGIHDARSLAEGYNRAAEKASGDILVFSHDDMELVTEDFASRLVAHLDHFDGVGIAGASSVTGPTWGMRDNVSFTATSSIAVPG